MKRHVIVVLVLVWTASVLGAFAGGAVLGMREEAKAATTIREMLAGLNALANYRGYADLASDLKAGRVGKAQCTVAVTGSAFVSSLQECLDSTVCSRLVMDQVKADAPELLAEPKVLAFRLYKHGERCSP